MNNKTALITGCNRGLGEGIRNILLKQGYTVIGLNRTVSNQKLKNYIEVKCDISNSENIEKAKEKATRKYKNKNYDKENRYAWIGYTKLDSF